MVVVALIVACGSPRRPEPSDATRREVASAEAALRRRDYDDARAGYARAIAQAPDATSEAFARRELADMLILVEDLAPAAHELERVTELRPDDPRAWHDLGIVRHSLGDIEGSATALGKAKTLAPGDPRPRIALAALFWERGAKDAALREYKELLELDLPPRLRDKVQWAVAQLSGAR